MDVGDFFDGVLIERRQTQLFDAHEIARERFAHVC